MCENNEENIASPFIVHECSYMKRECSYLMSYFSEINFVCNKVESANNKDHKTRHQHPLYVGCNVGLWINLS